MEKQEKICRFCLKNCDNNFKLIKENAMEILGILLESNLAINEEAVLCSNCTKNFKTCCNFKSKCHDVEDFIVQFINLKDKKAVLNLKDIYSSKEARDVPEGHDICRFCMDSSKVSSFMALDNEEEGIVLEKMIEKCLPELDVHITEKPVICVPCRDSLQHYFEFLTNFWFVEEKIKKHREVAGEDGTGLIKLKNILEVVTKNKIDKVDRIKMEEKFYRDEENVNKKKCDEIPCTFTNKDIEEVGIVKTEETFHELNCKVEIKPENLQEMGEHQFNSIPKLTTKGEEVDDQPDLMEMKHSYCQEMVNELEPKQEDLNSHQDVLSQMEIHVNLLKLQKCSVSHPHKTLPQILVPPEKKCLGRHLSAHKNPSKMAKYQCEHCSFQTKYNGSLKTHLLTHKKSSKSPTNQYKFDSHQTQYQCEHCSFQTKDEDSMKNHLLTHKNQSEISIYQCEHCSFQTNRKRNLKKHFLRHKNPSEITMYRCEHCSFQTKRKDSLKNHLLTHKNSSETTLYQCEHCSFQTKNKYQVKKHLLIHKNPSEITMYQCEHCSFQTKHKESLKNHFLIHKNSSETTLYQCEHCSFQTKHKYQVKKHLLTHKNVSEITMYECEHCSFQTKHTGSIKTHLLSHKNPSEITMYQCEYCSFQTKRKESLNNHLLTHKNPSEITLYPCEHCSFQTKYKYRVKKHLMTHKTSEITLY